ncbi:MAG: flagellar basal body rod protein FlgC, partial [Burkholderiales bacterium]
MSLFNVFDVAGTALTAQSQRLNTIASNLANADSVTTANGEPYRAKHVIFSSQPLAPENAVGVKVTGVVQDASPPRRVH